MLFFSSWASKLWPSLYHKNLLWRSLWSKENVRHVYWQLKSKATVPINKHQYGHNRKLNKNYITKKNSSTTFQECWLLAQQVDVILRCGPITMSWIMSGDMEFHWLHSASSVHNAYTVTLRLRRLELRHNRSSCDLCEQPLVAGTWTAKQRPFRCCWAMNTTSCLIQTAPVTCHRVTVAVATSAVVRTDHHDIRSKNQHFNHLYSSSAYRIVLVCNDGLRVLERKKTYVKKCSAYQCGKLKWLFASFEGC